MSSVRGILLQASLHRIFGLDPAEYYKSPGNISLPELLNLYDLTLSLLIPVIQDVTSFIINKSHKLHIRIGIILNAVILSLLQ